MSFKVAWRFLTIMLILALTVGCSGTLSEEPTPTPVPTSVEPEKAVYEVKKGEIVRSVSVSGRVAPVLEQQLFFLTSGYVDTVSVSRGEKVTAGDVLAELEVTDLKNQILLAEAALQSALDGSDQRIAEAQANLTVAQLQLAITKANNPAPQVTIASVNLERVQAEYDKLVEAEVIGPSLHEAELNLEVAQAQYDQALQSQEIYGYNVEIQEQAVTLAQMRLDQVETGADIIEYQLNVDRLKNLLDDARIVAPFDGIVLTISMGEGQAVEAYRPVIVVADPNEMEISVGISDANVLMSLEEGMSVLVTAISKPGEEYTGTIRRLPYPYGGGGLTGSELESSDESTRITLEKPVDDTGLVLGDVVRVVIILERVEDVLWLPPQAIRTFSGRRFVVVQEGAGQRRVDVKLGLEGDDQVEILEGLTEGQIVIGQ